MDRHQCGLADAEHVQTHQDRQQGFVDLAVEDAAEREVACPGYGICPDDRRQQQADGCGQKDAEIDARATAGFIGLLVGDERVGGQRQHFIEDEKRQQIVCVGDAHGRAKRDGETGIEACLVLLVVAAHVADGIERCDDPQA